ncbi:MAG: hypothetical protein CL840_14635 [Crocinitomicaceae bacterium]|nr:hypothetical protein [Crocinitomicaceae bacterium]|tara:strand:+ start:2705 stop:3226 length:522 start_codon:yes stop_codon:yes gene_type:complete
MKIEFSVPLEKHDSSLGWYYIVYVPKNLIKELGKEKNLRVKVTYNNREISHVSVKSKGDVRFLVMNSQLRKALKLVEGELVQVKVELETGKYGMPMPEELALMLEQDEQADVHFHNLTPGKQRSLIFIVHKLKNVDSRIKKALGIVEHLNEFNGELDYRALNEKIKEVNQRTM